MNSAGFTFKFQTLSEALNNEFQDTNINIQKYQRDNTDTDQHKNPYRIKERGQYQLTSDMVLSRDSDTLFAFFSSPLNLGLLTPGWMDFRITEIPNQIKSGSYIRYRYGLWWHEHLIIDNHDGTVTMRDRVIYRIPFWIFGRIAHKLFVKNTLMRIFRFRKQMINLRF